MKKVLKSTFIVLALSASFYSLSIGVSHELNGTKTSTIKFIEHKAIAGSDGMKIYKKGCFLKHGCKWHATNNNCRDVYINC